MKDGFYQLKDRRGLGPGATGPWNSEAGGLAWRDGCGPGHAPDGGREMKSETVIEMVRRRIVELGHDGLVSDGGECACEVSDLAPCGSINELCRSGIKAACPAECGEHDWHIKAVSE